MNFKSLGSWAFRNTANIVTWTRIVASMVLCGFVIAHTFYGRDFIKVIMFLFMAVALTDLIDGKLARALKIASKFGGALDCVADKVFLFVMFLFLVFEQHLSAPLKILIGFTAIVELGLFYYWVMGVARGMDASTSKVARGFGPGQWKMGFICAGVSACLLKVATFYPYCANILAHGLFILSFAFAVMSLLTRRSKYLEGLRRSSTPARRETVGA